MAGCSIISAARPTSRRGRCASSATRRRGWPRTTCAPCAFSASRRATAGARRMRGGGGDRPPPCRASARLSAERVWMELKRILAVPDPMAALALMAETGVLGAVLPEARPPGLLPRLVAIGAPADPLLRLAGCCRRTARRPRRLSRRLRFSGGEAALLDALLGGADGEAASNRSAPRADDGGMPICVGCSRRPTSIGAASMRRRCCWRGAGSRRPCRARNGPRPGRRRRGMRCARASRRNPCRCFRWPGVMRWRWGCRPGRRSARAGGGAAMVGRAGLRRRRRGLPCRTAPAPFGGGRRGRTRGLSGGSGPAAFTGTKQELA